MQPCVKSLFWFRVLYFLHSIFRLLKNWVKKLAIYFCKIAVSVREQNCWSWLTWILSSLKTRVLNTADVTMPKTRVMISSWYIVLGAIFITKKTGETYLTVIVIHLLLLMFCRAAAFKTWLPPHPSWATGLPSWRNTWRNWSPKFCSWAEKVRKYG